MRLQDLLYRQKSRWKYHTAKTEVEKRIAEINRNRSYIELRNRNYYIPEADLKIPKGVVDEVFIRFDLFMQNMKNLNGTYRFEDGKLFFLFDRFKIRIVSPNELFIINEIFFNNCYNFSLPNQQSYNVIDIGMNVGLASLYFANRRDICEVFSFEPFPQTFMQAKGNFDNTPELASKIKSFNFGLGKGERMEISSYSPYASGTSGTLLKSKDADVTVYEQAISIRDAFETLTRIVDTDPETPFVLKVDCEGAEYEILESLIEGGFPERIIAILMEWHGSFSSGLQNRVRQLGFNLINTRTGNNTGMTYAVR